MTKSSPGGIFRHPYSHFHMSAVTPSSLSCLDPSVLSAPRMIGLHHDFTVSGPQAAHATPARTLMPPDLEQVVYMIPSEGFDNTGATFCRAAEGKGAKIFH